MAAKFETDVTITRNRRAKFDYFIEDTVEAGVVLTGTEVKSLRANSASLNESYAGPKDGAIYLINVHIPEYQQAGAKMNHEPRRPRKLLLHKREQERLMGQVRRGGYTLVPVRLYFNKRGMLKVDLGLAKGKRQYDKRQSEKQRDWKRDQARILRNKDI